MKRSKWHFAITFALCSVLVGGTAFSAGPGGGSGSGSGGGGMGSDFGDLVVLLRDAYGVPILNEGCEQPIASDGTTIPLDLTTCTVQVGSEILLQPVDFGRMNVARAPSTVVDRQLADLVVNLGTAQCITLDPAGRLVATTRDAATNELTSKAVDSPLQNLAIYREMMLKGTVGSPSINLPAPFDSYGTLDTAAKALGAACDKEGKLTVDEIVYLNQILGLTNKATSTVLPKRCIMVKDEVQGQMVLVEKCFLDYSAYRYSRSQTYGNLPYPPYIPGSDGVGTFEYLTLYPVLVSTEGKPLFWITTGQIAEIVFANETGGAPSDFSAINIAAFAQASDDARAVIDFTHDHPVLEGYQTPIPCGTPPVASYDIALSALQVPVNMVAGTTREGTVTVENEGPDAASGTFTVEGILQDGSSFFSRSVPFSNLAAGATMSETLVFTAPSAPTTITWTATVTASHDVQLGNNTLTETSVVIAPTTRISGTGYNFPVKSTDVATFSMDVTGPDSPAGSVNYYFKKKSINFMSTGITSVSASGSTYSVAGTGKLNGNADYAFTISVTDGNPDTFSIQIRKPQGQLAYSALPQALSSGGFSVTQE